MPLKLSCATTDPIKASADMLAVGVFAADSISSTSPVAAIDQALGGALADLISRQEFGGKRDQVLEIDTLGRLPFKRLMLFGLGDQAELEAAGLRTFAARAARSAQAAKATSVAVALAGKLEADHARALGEGLVLGAYRFTKYLTGDRLPKTEIGKAVLLGTGKLDKIRKAADLGLRIGQSVCYARDLINEPANELTPVALADFAKKVAKKHKLTCKVHDAAAIKRMGMKLFIAVGQGSTNEPRLVHLTYKPAKAPKKRLVVVGKGLTFDSGGLCIKPAPGMGEMKSDMSGAANVVGFMAAVAEIAPNVEVHGLIGAAENMPDGNAYRPGDVFGSLDGKTVEIINTDAEGRLVLADVLTYATKLKPDVMICNATLTGACVVALGQHCSGFYATKDELAEQFGKAAKEAGEQFWHMPLLEDLREQLKSDVADLKHMGDRWGGSITAALFLREFVGESAFVHCDIAGPALADKPYSFYTKGGTGHGVLTFLRFLETF